MNHAKMFIVVYVVYNFQSNLTSVSSMERLLVHPPPSPPEDGSAHPCVEMLSSFFETYVRRRFADGRVSCYVLDVYLDSQERVWVVDFNVWGSRTDGLLFTWEELANFGDDEAERDPELRVVTKNMKSSHLTYDPLSSFRGPTDVVNLMQGANGTSDQDLGDIPTFQDFMKQCVRPSEM